jgi:hypothetical protein
MIAGILVLWSPERVNQSISQFRRLLKGISSDTHLIVVLNNPLLSVVPEDFSVIRWTNELYEFGGWDYGLSTLDCNLRKKLQLVVFGNDTFSFHRSWATIDKWAFQRAFARAAQTDAAILTGATSTFNKPFDMEDVRLNSWISTYLFAINPELLERLEWRLGANRDTLAHFVKGGVDEDAFFSSEMSINLREHLTAWLFVRQGKHRWRNAEPLSRENHDRFLEKARCIVCEKLLTARSLALGGTIRSVYGQFPLPFLLRVSSYFREL